jgi:hypothetical protein
MYRKSKTTNHQFAQYKTKHQERKNSLRQLQTQETKLNGVEEGERFTTASPLARFEHRIACDTSACRDLHRFAWARRTMQTRTGCGLQEEKGKETAIT